MADKKEREAKEKILKYLTDQNRPFNLNDIVANLHKTVQKAVGQRALNVLVEEGKIRQKEYGKQKIFYVNQEGLNVGDEKENAEIETKLDSILKDLSDKEASVKQSEGILKDIVKTEGTEEAKRKVENLKLNITQLNVELERRQKFKESLGAGGAELSTETKAKQAELAALQKVCRARKRTFEEMMDNILDQMEGVSKSDLYDEIGIEDDE